jgi:hypothetical protein
MDDKLSALNRIGWKEAADGNTIESSANLGANRLFELELTYG